MERTGLATDRYELTMVDAALRSGVANRRAVFEVFTRRLPEGRHYGVVAGMSRVVDAIERFRFSADDVESLRQLAGNPLTMSADLVAWLREYRFSGDVVGYDEGELFGPHSPILTVAGSFAEAVVLETVVLSILNHDCAVAAAASVMVAAAKGRPLIEMGSRRTDPEAAVAAARAAMIAGFARTSNLEAGRRYGVETGGTASHAFTLAHRTEAEAFRAQLGAQGVGTTVLVDTYDVDNGVRYAVAVAQEFGVSGPGAIRIDSGDLVLEAKRARVLLDELGAHTTRIVLSGDLTAQSITDLVAADTPVDVFGVGTSVVTGDGHPTAALAYKLVEIEGDDGSMRPVAKLSAGKLSLGGRKTAHRRAAVETIQLADAVAADPQNAAAGRPLLMTYIEDGITRYQPTVFDARRTLQTALVEVGDAGLTTVVDIPVPDLVVPKVAL